MCAKYRTIDLVVDHAEEAELDETEELEISEDPQLKGRCAMFRNLPIGEASVEELDEIEEADQIRLQLLHNAQLARKRAEMERQLMTMRIDQLKAADVHAKKQLELTLQKKNKAMADRQAKEAEAEAKRAAQVAQQRVEEKLRAENQAAVRHNRLEKERSQRELQTARFRSAAVTRHHRPQGVKAPLPPQSKVRTRSRKLLVHQDIATCYEDATVVPDVALKRRQLRAASAPRTRGGPRATSASRQRTSFVKPKPNASVIPQPPAAQRGVVGRGRIVAASRRESARGPARGSRPGENEHSEEASKAPLPSSMDAADTVREIREELARGFLACWDEAEDVEEAPQARDPGQGLESLLVKLTEVEDRLQRVGSRQADPQSRPAVGKWDRNQSDLPAPSQKLENVSPLEHEELDWLIMDLHDLNTPQTVVKLPSHHLHHRHQHQQKAARASQPQFQAPTKRPAAPATDL